MNELPSLETLVIPDLAEPIVAWRDWRVVGDKLVGQRGMVWTDTDVTAACYPGVLWSAYGSTTSDPNGPDLLAFVTSGNAVSVRPIRPATARHHDTEVPAIRCCGVYAYREPHNRQVCNLDQAFPFVYGEVFLWGRVL